jgi:DNA mismatch endonuclease (patch repair protein)
MGYRFRLHRKDLPGKPDIVLPKYKTVIEVRGCFWHRHQGCKQASTPKSNEAFWQEKFSRNVARDRRNTRLLKKLGWRVIIIWECETKAENRLMKKLAKLENRSQESGVRSQESGVRSQESGVRINPENRE